MSTRTAAEQIALAVQQLGAGVSGARTVLTERALVLMVSDICHLSPKTVMQVIKAIERLPETMLTAHGRAIRIRED